MKSVFTEDKFIIKKFLNTWGDKVVIAKAGKPCVELLPHQEKIITRQAGRLKGKIVIPDD